MRYGGSQKHWAEMPGARALGSNAPLPFSSRTIYYTGYGQVYSTEAQTVFRCCPGWSQQPGSQGCLSRECPPTPAPPVEATSSVSLPGVGPTATHDGESHSCRGDFRATGSATLFPRDCSHELTEGEDQ